MWNVAVERQIRVKGPDAEKFTDYVITRDATKISPMRARYVILCNAYGGVLNDPILLRISKDEFWFSLSDSDIGMYLQGVNAMEDLIAQLKKSMHVQYKFKVLNQKL